jgi:hypothetical protein
MDRDGGIIGELLMSFGPPVLLCLIAIVVLSYLVSIGKKRLAVALGAPLFMIGIGWLVINQIR